jgi:hypothetical protein
MPANTSNHQPDWDFILNTLEEGRCVFLLGPGMARLEADKKPFFSSFVQSLDVANNPRIASYYERDEFFLFAHPPRQNKSPVFYKLKQFYKEKPYWREPYRLLAELPFRLLINTGPDSFLSEVMEEEPVRNHATAHFDRSQAQLQLPEFDKGLPLIYNIMGKLEEEESLVLSHEDLFAYLEAALARDELPKGLMSELYDARSFVFLGFNFEQWYVQLLLRLLRLHSSHGLRYATEQKFNADTLSICEEQFHIEFVGEDVIGFLQNLHQQAAARDLLWSPDSEHSLVSAQARLHLQAGEFQPALDSLLGFFEKHDKELAEEARLHSSIYNRLRKRIRQKILTREEAEVQQNKLTYALQDLILEAQSLEQAGT